MYIITQTTYLKWAKVVNLCWIYFTTQNYSDVSPEGIGFKNKLKLISMYCLL
jgi:hypothetical protein